jgi:HlyD family secretion protein
VSTTGNPRRIAFLALGALVVLAGTWLAWRTFRPRHTAMAIPTATIARRDIAQTVEATGTVEPIEIVEIKSKASGQILKMPVEIGSVVKSGDLLAQIDTVTVRNQYDEAYAALQAARAQVEISTAQKKRSDELFTREVITADDHEAATLAYANAVSTLARTRGDLDNARMALADANVRAPSDGTIIEQDATKGTVIASATASASGGTTLLKMANLQHIQLQALVGETDIGNVWPGQSATVTVDAFPNRPFRGQVIKIEPQAQVQQSVTMFPVLIAIDNENGLLLPGMNGEVTISIAQRNNVMAVPLDAVRSMREIPTVAIALGMDADSLRANVQRQMAERMGGSGRDSSRGGRDSTGVRSRGGNGWMRGSSAGMGGFAGDAQAGGFGGGGRGGNGGGRAGGWAGRNGGFSDSARAAYARRMGGGGPGGGSRDGRGGASGRGGAMAGGDSTRNFTSGNGRGQTQIAFLATPHGFEPRLVRLGVSDYDYAEVLGGLHEGDEVALVSVAEVQAKRQQDIDRTRQRMNTGMPGMPGGGAAGAGGGGRGGFGGGGGR